MTDNDKLRAAIHGWKTGDYGHMEASFANQLVVDAARLVLAAQSAESAVEAAAKAICASRDRDPMTLLQHFYGEYPIDSIHKYDSRLGAGPQKIELHYAWRTWVKSAEAALTAASLFGTVERGAVTREQARSIIDDFRKHPSRPEDKRIDAIIALIRGPQL
jgi:hypothetical protein